VVNKCLSEHNALARVSESVHLEEIVKRSGILYGFRARISYDELRPPVYRNLAFPTGTSKINILKLGPYERYPGRRSTLTLQMDITVCDYFVRSSRTFAILTTEIIHPASIHIGALPESITDLESTSRKDTDSAVVLSQNHILNGVYGR